MMKLFILNGKDRGCLFDLKNDTSYVGRSSDNDIQINDSSISRKHLMVLRKKDKFVIEDLLSRNGTFVNGTRINAGEGLEVAAGIPISIGNVYFSLGKSWAGDVLPVQDSMGESDNDLTTLTNDISRPMTTPRNLELIYKVSNVLMQSLDINIILEKILDYIFDLLRRIDRGVIILIDHETGKILEVISRANMNGDDTVMMYSRTVVDRVIREGTPVMMSNTLVEDDADRSESMELMKIRSVMCVPLISKSQMRGVIYVDSLDKPYGFRKEDLALLNVLSGPAAIAIENALIYSNLEKIVENRTKTLRQTEEKLRESEARFKAIFNNMSSGVVVYKSVDDGQDFIVFDLNRADEKIENTKKTEKLHKSIRETSPELRDINLMLSEILQRVWETGTPESRTFTITSDEKITAAREYYVYRLPSGEIVAIYDDVTDKKKAEAEQKALQEQLFRSQKMESIGAFAGGTAHNFRNILQAISGNIEYLEMISDENAEITDLAKSIHDSVEKGVDLINNLLHFSKRDGEYQLVDVNLADIIRETYEIVDRVFDKNLEIELDLEKDLFVQGNRTLLSQVFMNLFTNSRDAMPDGGKLSIEANKKRNKVIAIVSDTGHGMDKETLGKIFDPFFTLKEVGRGTGLGLSTTHGIVEQHKGSISVKSQPGQGTTFKIMFPLAKGKKPQEPKPQSELIFGKGQKILIIDDERPSLEAIANLVKSLGYEAIPCNRPVEALKNYGNLNPEAVLIDRNMPEIDGGTCTKEIKKVDSEARIIIVSGYEEDGPDGIDESVKDIIVGYLTKPFGLADLSRALHRALGRQKTTDKMSL